MLNVPAECIEHMFGYIVPHYGKMMPSAYATYQRYYCETCHQLRSGFGLISTLAVSYDMTFNTIAINSAADGEHVRHTPSSPLCVFKGPYANTSVFGSLAAYTVLLAKWELVDDDTDKPSIKSKIASLAFGRAIAKAERQFPECDEAIGTGFGELRRMELSGRSDPIRMGHAFGTHLSRALTDIAGIHGDNAEMKDMFADLTAAVYLMDAVDDLDEDYMNGTYNPFLVGCERFINKERFIGDNVYAVTERMNEAIGALQRSYSAVRKGMVRNTDVTDNIIYHGIPNSARSVLNCSCSSRPSAMNMIRSRMKRSVTQ